MYHLSDKDLDRLSKEAAEKYEVESSTSGWEAVEAQLNKKIPPNANDRKKRRFLFFLIFFVLFSGTGLTLMLLNNNSSISNISASTQLADQPENKRPVANASSDIKKSIAEKEDQAHNNNELSGDSISSKNKNDRDDNKSNDNASDNNNNQYGNKEPDKELAEVALNQSSVLVADKDQIEERNQISSSAQTKKQPLAKNGSGRKQSLEKSREEIISQQSNPVSTPEAAKRKIVDQRADPISTLNENAEKELKPKYVTGIERLRDVPDVQRAVANLEKGLRTEKYAEGIASFLTSRKRNNADVPIGLQVGLAYAPDYSNVRFTHGDKVGFNAGLTIGYRFNKRWSVNTGVILTKKNYTAYGKDYHPPKDYWTYNVYLSTVNANCNMLDIPLNVRYDFISNKKNHAFLSTGLSTYFMNKETYDYHFTYNGVYGREKRTYDDKTKHWFSILNLSTGYERRIDRRFSLQLEPYLKIPVKGLGFGKVDLNSYGAYFSVKYQLLSK